MTNVIKKCARFCIEWTVKTPDSNVLLASDFFLYQCVKCHLKLSLGVRFQANSYDVSYLRFHHDGELKSSINTLVRVTRSSRTVSAQSQTMTDTGTGYVTIWSSSEGGLLRGTLLTIDVIIDDISTDDKSVQTSSYIDTRFMLESISHDFSKLLEDGPNHDVEFTCGDQSIKVHKDILCTRSDVFASMLRSDMVEGTTRRVNIQDMDASIFCQFLKCLYTGKPPELTVDEAIQFYQASDKYAVSSLKEQCADFLIDNLSRENVCDILVLADRHNDSHFKKAVIEYVLDERVPIVGENWPDFCKENSILAVEVLNLFCQHLSRK